MIVFLWRPRRQGEKRGEGPPGGGDTRLRPRYGLNTPLALFACLPAGDGTAGAVGTLFIQQVLRVGLEAAYKKSALSSASIVVLRPRAAAGLLRRAALRCPDVARATSITCSFALLASQGGLVRPDSATLGNLDLVSPWHLDLAGWLGCNFGIRTCLRLAVGDGFLLRRITGWVLCVGAGCEQAGDHEGKNFFHYKSLFTYKGELSLPSRKFVNNEAM